MNCLKRYIAEFIGTMFLVLFGCGVAVATNVSGNAGIIATALAFGLALIGVSYCFGHISGCHVNPAVTIAFWINKKISFKDCIGYIIAQMLGATLAVLEIGLFFGGLKELGGNQTQAVLIGAYGDTPSLFVALAVEAILTCAFVLVVLGVSSRRNYKSVSGVVIGIALIVVHLLGIRLTGTSVNPARSFGPALVQAFAGETTAIMQIWIFILGPIFGAIVASIIYRCLSHNEIEE